MFGSAWFFGDGHRPHRHIEGGDRLRWSVGSKPGNGGTVRRSYHRALTAVAPPGRGEPHGPRRSSAEKSCVASDLGFSGVAVRGCLTGRWLRRNLIVIRELLVEPAAMMATPLAAGQRVSLPCGNVAGRRGDV